MPVRPWPVTTEPRVRGKVLAGRYRMDALVGRGGAADVYEGFDLRLRRPVAVKVFRGSEAQTEERFQEEAVLLARLQHPGLVTVYDSGREAGLPFLVMHLIKGSTLRARVTAGPLSAAVVRDLGAALGEALAHVHAAGVVHRDVKPSNILLDETGAPHLTDFGISRLIDSTQRTATGALVGTAAYLAPEQVMGRAVGPAADVYALGLTLLECLKGELEYDGAPLEAAIARLHRPPVIPVGLDEELSGLLQAMTALDEAERPDALSCAAAFASMVPGPAVGVPPFGATGVRDAGEGAAVAGEGVAAAEKGAGPDRRTGCGLPDTVAAPPEVSGARRRNGRTLATAGAALATLLGVGLAGSIGALSGEDGDSASRAPEHAPTASAPEPSSTPTPPDGRTGPAAESPASGVRTADGASSASAADGRTAGAAEQAAERNGLSVAESGSASQPRSGKSPKAKAPTGEKPSKRESPKPGKEAKGH